MPDIDKLGLIKRFGILFALAFGALSVMLLLPQGRAMAQGNAGPMSGAAPSDQPQQTTSQASANVSRSTAPIGGKPNLAGTWQLNVDQSDNPMEKMREARQESGEGGGYGGGGGRMGGGGMGGGGGWGGRRGGQNGAGQQGPRGGMRAMSELVIEQTPTSAKVSDSSGRVIAQYTSTPDQNSSQQSSANSDTNSAAPAQWQDNRLVSTVQMPNGGTTTRSYEMSPDNKQLIVTTKIEAKRLKNPVTIKQVYDPVYASTGRN